jgi:hypothetical protein
VSSWSNYCVISVSGSTVASPSGCILILRVALSHNLGKLDPGYELPKNRILRCYDGTRKAFMAKIRDWTIDFDAPNIMWISADPGAGKSTIASHIAHDLKLDHRLGSFFSFDRTAQSSPSVLWRMNAHELASTYPPCSTSIAANLSNFSQNTTAGEIFREFIEKPLQQLASNPDCVSTARLPVVVIDALDECAIDRDALLSNIKKWSELPRIFKLVVTSRREDDIASVFSGSPHIPHYPLPIPTGAVVDPESIDDIRRYIDHRLHQIRARHKYLDSTWPGQDAMDHLTQGAAGLFIWAVTATRFIEDFDPEARLSRIMSVGLSSTGGPEGVYVLYRQLLETSLPSDLPELSQSFPSIAGAIVVSQKALSAAQLSQLLRVKRSVVEFVQQRLQPVLEGGELVRFSHKSFVDFLTQHGNDSAVGADQLDTPHTCPKIFRVHTQEAHHLLLLSSFDLMNEQLRFNICDMTSSFLPNSSLLSDHFRNAITPTVEYACRFWDVHLSNSPLHFDILSAPFLRTFLNEKLLFWLEALSGLGAFHGAYPALAVLLGRIQRANRTQSVIIVLYGVLKQI